MTGRNLKVAPPPGTAAPLTWKDTLNKIGAIYLGTASNIEKIFVNEPCWQGVVGYNDFTQKVMLLKQPPFVSVTPGINRPWGDTDDVQTAAWLADQKMPRASGTEIAAAVDVASKRNRFNPVQDYLSKLVWDKEPRLDTWLTRYLGVEESQYSLLVGAKWMIAAVARIYEPGCQADTTLILEGPQGEGKSSALRILAGSDWFTDDIADLGSKDAAQQLPGKWIIELSELSSMGRPALETAKAFLTRRVDHYRPSYGRRAIDLSRSCIFAGTTNARKYFQDEENRRFWPVKCTTIKLAELETNRDQLWAEAVFRYKAKDSWYLSREVAHLAVAEQEDRMYVDPWQDDINDFLDKTSAHGFTPIAGGMEVGQVITADTVRQRGWLTSEILRHCCNVDIAHQTAQNQRRVVACLKKAGWEQKGVWDSTRKQKFKRYCPKT